MAEFTGAKTDKNEDIPFNGQGSDTSNTHDGAGIGAKRNFSIWEDDADYSMNW